MRPIWWCGVSPWENRPAFRVSRGVPAIPAVRAHFIGANRVKHNSLESTIGVQKYPYFWRSIPASFPNEIPKYSAIWSRDAQGPMRCTVRRSIP